MVKGQKQLFLPCSCDANYHMVVFTYWPRQKDLPAEMIIACQLVPGDSFWERLKLAFKYLFKKVSREEYGFWNDTFLSEEGITELKNFIDSLPKQGKDG